MQLLSLICAYVSKHRPPNKDEEADKIFCKQPGKVSQLLAFFPMGDLEMSAGNTIQLRGDSERFLECVEEGPEVTSW